ncbi:MAG: hypothetical protein AAF585_29150 [Verrucomicrobiota bacterium]
MKPDADQFLADLICNSNEAAERDSAQVELGLDTRVLSWIREEGAGEQQLLERWANGFLRGALVSAAAVALLIASAWFTTDLLGIEGDIAFSALADGRSQLEFWSSNW